MLTYNIRSVVIIMQDVLPWFRTDFRICICTELGGAATVNSCTFGNFLLASFNDVYV